MTEKSESKKCAYCGVEGEAEHAAGCPKTMQGDEAKQADAKFRSGYHDALMMPSKRGPHSDDVSYMLGWKKTDDHFGPGDGPRVGAKWTYTRIVPVEVSIAEERVTAVELFGREVHIQFKVGPIQETNRAIECPISAVDDSFLSGPFNRLPPDGHYLLIGYFK